MNQEEHRSRHCAHWKIQEQKEHRKHSFRLQRASGKHFLAAFDSKKYEKVLFVAHREEILKQAAVSFQNVRNSKDYGFFMGAEKCTDKPLIFASVASLGKPEYLNEKYFAPDYFNYVVIDEFHHAVNDQYRRIVEYFRPQFLLGLTATPERMDGKNIYESAIIMCRMRFH